ncbi:MAG: O-antigen ligase family protein [Candidatus Acidoferrales bacterium]
MERAGLTVLVVAMVGAVAAFGGTEPLAFAVVQLGLLGLALGVLLARLAGRAGAGAARLPLLVPLLLVVLVLLQLASLWASLAGRTLSLAPYQTKSHLLLWVTYLAAFYLTLEVARRGEGRKRLVWALVFLGAGEAFYGLVQVLTGWQPLQGYVREGLTPLGTYVNANHFAGLLEMTLPFALALAYYEFRRLPSVRGSRAGRLRALLGEPGLERVLFWAFLGLLMLAAVALAGSRMGLLAALGSLWVLAMLVGARGAGPVRVGVVMVAFLAAAALLMVWLGAFEPLVERFQALEYEYAQPERGRWSIWQDTVRLIEGHPWLGVGLGAFPEAYRGVQTAYPTKTVLQAHNDYLHLAAEVGLVGALLVFGSFFYLLAAAGRRFLRAESSLDQAVALGCAGSIAALLLHSLTDFNLQIPANALVFSVVLGLAYAVRWPGSYAGEARGGRG